MSSDDIKRMLAENAGLKAYSAGLKAQNTRLLDEVAGLRSRLDQLIGLAAGQNDRLADLTAMLRRREDQLRRGERKSDDDEPDDDGSGGGGSGGGGGSSGAGASSGKGKKKRKPRSKGGRKPIAQHLPIDEERHTPACCAHCGSDELLARDTEVSDKYTVIKEHVRRRRIVREVKVCKRCNKATTASMPPMPTKRAHYTCDFLAWLMVQKFILLTPLDRVRRHLLNQGIDIPESTLVYLVELAAKLLDPVDGEHWKQLKAGSWIQTDGTGLKVLIEGQDKAWDGYFDVFARDALTVFQFGLTKHADDHAARFQGFDGTILCDAESRFNLVCETRDEANCNAHAVRKFRDAEQGQPVLAKEGGDFLRAMYEVEAEARRLGLGEEDLAALRQRKTRPIADQFKQWLELVEPTLLRSDPLGKAVRYYLNQYNELTYFIDHAEIPIDNNGCERLFQNHAKLRFNSLFAGSVEGGHRWATLAGIIATAHKVGVDVFAYLIWAFERLGTHRKQFGLSAEQLTPMAYKQSLLDVERLAVAA